MIHTHLFGIETGEPGILRDLFTDKSNSLLTGYLDGRLTLLPIIKPRFRPTAVALRIEIDGSHTVHVIALHINLQRGQRVNYKTVGCCLFFLFSCFLVFLNTDGLTTVFYPFILST